MRINPLDTSWGLDDLQAVVEALPDGIVLPKVAKKKDVMKIDSIVGDIERQNQIEEGSISFVLIGPEVPEAVFNLHKMAKIPRVDAITWGAEDLSGALGAKAKRDSEGNYLEGFSYVRSACLLAAVAGDANPIDAVYVDIKNPDGLTQECEDGAKMGYTGKVTIHPSQIDIVNNAFTPTLVEIAEAEELIAAFKENESKGKMAFSYKGQMVDVPHLVRAKEILLKAKINK